MKIRVVIFRGLAATLLFSSAGCDKRASHAPATSSATPEVPREVPRELQQVKQELIVALRADLEKLRLDKDPSRNEIYRLAQALDQVMREDPSAVPDRGNGNWNAEVQALASRKTADLAAEYIGLRQSALAEAGKEREILVENTAKRIAAGMFEAKSATELDATLLEITELQSKLSAESGSQSTYGQLQLFRQFIVTWREFLKLRDSGESTEAIRCLERLNGFTAQPIRWLDPVLFSSALQAATQSLGIPSKEQFDANLSSIVERALAASKSTDLDGLLVETKKLKSFGGRLPERGAYRISVVERFVENVQGVIFARETGNGPKFREFLARVENQETDELGVSRSRFLVYVHDLNRSIAPAGTQALTPAASPDAAAARMTSLEAIIPNLPALRLALDASPGIRFASPWRMDLLMLESMAKKSEQLKAGRGLQRPVHENGLKMTSNPSIRELQRQYDMLCLNITFSEETRLLPEGKETVRDFTARLKSKLQELKKWESLQTLYTATRALKITEPVINADDDAAVSGFLYGIRLESEAKDLRMATCAFQSVLTSSSKVVPSSLVGSHLEAIRKADPQAYKQGSELALNLSKSEGKRAPGERAEALQWIIPARKPWNGR